MASKKHFTLNIDSEVAEKAIANPEIQVSELTEKFLRACSATSKTENNEKRYKAYQELFGLMLPVLRKFKVQTHVACEIISWTSPEPTNWDEDGQTIEWGDQEPEAWWDYYLLPNGKILREQEGEIEIKDIKLEDFFRPKDIIDNFLNSVQESADYRKNPFKEIEMAKTIIDAITKGVFTKSTGKGR